MKSNAERTAKYRKNNPEKSKKSMHDWMKRNPDKVKSNKLKYRYGIDLAKYNEMFAAQEGSCAICRVHQKDLPRALAVDHCHYTGKVRSLLCARCNKAIGMLEDSAELVQIAANYLKLHIEGK